MTERRVQGSAQSAPAKFVVVGSINWDIVVTTGRFRAGESVIGIELNETQGGKGANQAVALARMGASVALLARVGSDDYARRMINGLAESGVGTEYVMRTEDCSSGVAVITVDDVGENCITAIPGANQRVTPDDVERNRALIEQADVLLVQFEIPLESVLTAIQIAKGSGTIVVLDPAPFKDDAPSGLFEVNYVCPNETEAESITGVRVSGEADAIRAAEQLTKMGSQTVIITRGKCGALLRNADENIESIPAFTIDAIDSTAAGDAFAAGLALAIAEGNDDRAAVQFACAAGAFAASRLGALPSMPNRSEVERILNSHG